MTFVPTCAHHSQWQWVPRCTRHQPCDRHPDCHPHYRPNGTKLRQQERRSRVLCIQPFDKSKLIIFYKYPLTSVNATQQALTGCKTPKKTTAILAVREITKSSSTFSATNTSSNVVWSISTAWYNPNEIKWNLILVPNLVAFISQKEKNVCFFRLSFVNLQRAKDRTHMFDAKYRYVFVV